MVLAVLAAVMLLSACGDRFVAPAAVVSGHRITTETLKDEFDTLLLDPQLAQQMNGPQGEKNRKDLTRSLLSYLIQVQLLEQYASGKGISVTPAEVDQALEGAIAGVGGQAQFDQELKARGLTMAGVRRNLERSLLFGKVQDALAAQAGLGSTASSDERNRVFQRWFTNRLRSADIEVNPRFGRLDLRTGQVVQITSTAT
jgi:SurA-like protein